MGCMGCEPTGFPLTITAVLWMFWGKESTLLVLRVDGEMGWGGLRAVKRGLSLIEFHGLYWYLVPVFVGADGRCVQGIITLVRWEGLSFRS